MKGFERRDRYLSLCGLNCVLCPMRVDGYCPGCGGGRGNQPCAIARCSLSHGGVEYCFQCGEYSCQRYEGIDQFDSFITHQNQQANLTRAQSIGPEAYQAEQWEKAQALGYLLEHCNDGRRKSFFCTAVNLLTLEEVHQIMAQLRAQLSMSESDLKQRAALAAGLFQAAAERQGITLKLRRKK